ncbi:MAG: SsrA-binding protein SmpB [Candidatus Woykebacteria bacterium]
MKPIVNKKAGFNYELLEKIEAGIVLTGDEIKQVRAGKISLDEAYVLLRGGEAFLTNAHIAAYEKGALADTDSRRSRKLLLNKKEIDYLAGKLAGTNLTIVPTRLYFMRNYAKIQIALARGKKKYDKREAIKRREEEKEAQKFLRSDKLKYQREHLNKS